MKQLAPEIQSEIELDLNLSGKVFAYCAVTGDKAEARLGIAVANQPGYHPVPEFFANGTFDQMMDEADRLNDAAGRDRLDAAKIICSSMRRPKWHEKVGEPV